jgi:hypothetical protein
VPDGPRAFRNRIRRLGPFVGTFPASLLGLLAVLLLRHNVATTRGIAGFAATVFAAPALLAAGIPLTGESSRMMIGIAASIVLWLVVGVVATRRATRSPVATWTDYWREYLWLAGGIWIGVCVGLFVIQLVLGRAVL